MVGKRIQQDDNGGHLIRVNRKEWWRVGVAASIVFGGLGLGVKATFEDVLEIVKNQPTQSYRIEQVETSVKSLHDDVDDLTVVLARLTGTLERIEAELDKNNGRYESSGEDR